MPNELNTITKEKLIENLKDKVENEILLPKEFNYLKDILAFYNDDILFNNNNTDINSIAMDFIIQKLNYEKIYNLYIDYFKENHDRDMEPVCFDEFLNNELQEPDVKIDYYKILNINTQFI